MAGKMHPAEGKAPKMGSSYSQKFKVADKLTGGLKSPNPPKEMVHAPKNKSATHAARNAKDGKITSIPMPKMKSLKS